MNIPTSLLVLFILQLMGIGLILGKFGEPKKSKTYGVSDLIAVLVHMGLLIWLYMEI